MTDTSQQTLTQRAAVLEAFGKPLSIRDDWPIPQALPGSVVVEILSAPLPRYIRTFYEGTIPAPRLEPPFVPNPKALGRIHKVGSGAAALQEGDLVYAEPVLLARDDPDVFLLLGHIKGLPGPRSDRLAEGDFRDGSFQQYQRLPLENVYLINESRIKERGIPFDNLISIANLSVAAGAIFDAGDIRVSDTVVIGPSGGSFGGSAVELALVVGARVVALGRHADQLAELERKLNSPRLTTVVMTGDTDADAAAILAATPDGAGADVYNDWSPGGVPTAPFLPAAERAVKRGGRIVLSGGASGHIEVPFISMVVKKLTVVGSGQCNRQSMQRLIRMIEDGHLDLGPTSGTQVKKFKLDEIYQAIDHAEETTGWRNHTIIVPNN